MKSLIATTALVALAALPLAADNLSLRYGQGACTQTVDNDTGRSMEFYGEVDEFTDESNIGFRYVIEFQKPVPSNNPCKDMQRIATQRMQLDLERARLELELLRARVAAEKAAAEAEPNPRLDDDW